MKNEKLKVKNGKCKKNEIKMGYLGRIFLFSLFIIHFSFATACDKKKESGVTVDTTTSTYPAETSEKEYAETPEITADTATPISPPAIVDLFKYDEAKTHFISYNNWFSSRYDFRIWGWSKDGKVAYSYTEFQDGAGWETKYFYILNFIDDEIIWKYSIDDYEGKQMLYTEGEGSAEGPPIDYDSLYRRYMNICKDEGIEFIQAEFKKIPIMHNNKVYNVVVDQNKRNDSDDYGYDTVKNYKIVVETQGKSKVINEDTFSEPVVFDIFSLGYFISPLENRSLIIVGRHIRHWEGTNNDYIFVGCHLDIGFK
jgi:hypothetical protein